MLNKHTPGPVGTSCLTCKRRRKKCDRARPGCERCTTGGFQCLGYEHNDKSPVSSLDSPRDSSQREDTTDGGSARSYRSPPLLFPDDTHLAIDNAWMMLSSFTPPSLKKQPATPATSPSIISSNFPAPHLNCHIAQGGKECTTFKQETSLFSESGEHLPAWQNHSLHQTYSAASSLVPLSRGSISCPETSAQLAPPSFYPWQSLQSQGDGFVFPIPRSLPPVSTDIAGVINYVLSQFERMFALSYFKPVQHQVMRVRESVSRRLQSSNAARWAMYIGAQIFESLLDGVLPEKTGAYNRWIQRFERELHLTPNRALTNDEIQSRLSGTLEIGFLKLRLKGNFHVLQLLRNCAPAFLQIALSDPALWPSGGHFTAVSIAHIFASARYELGLFILLDAFCAMAYALPPTLDYDTSYPPFGIDSHPTEWINGCPIIFHMALIEINTRCALGHVAHDWQDIEQRIQSWQPCFNNPTGEGWKDIARLAVQESWRQALLVYLYMAVCGVASDDPRVQSGVKQIFQLLGTVRRQDPPIVNVHFFIQYLIAGACTPSEKRRAFIRSRMLNQLENGLWLLRGADFVPVLDHLWHGAASNGRPIRWSDYMASRQAALPVPI